MDCPSPAQTNKNLECSFKYSGIVDSITLSAPGSSTETGSLSSFVTQYGSPGTFQISLTACSEATQTVVVVDAPSGQPADEEDPPSGQPHGEETGKES